MLKRKASPQKIESDELEGNRNLVILCNSITLLMYSCLANVSDFTGMCKKLGSWFVII